MRQGSVHGFRHLQVVIAVVAAQEKSADSWPAWASLLLVLGAGVASWTAIILTASSLAG